MKDVFGVELEVGMLVGYTTRGRYNYTHRGHIVRMTAKRAWVADIGSTHASPKVPEHLTVSITSEGRT